MRSGYRIPLTAAAAAIAVASVLLTGYRAGVPPAPHDLVAFVPLVTTMAFAIVYLLLSAAAKIWADPASLGLTTGSAGLAALLYKLGQQPIIHDAYAYHQHALNLSSRGVLGF